jgi:hypothetical protein
MFEYIKNFFAGGVSFVGVDLSGEMEPGTIYRALFRPSIPGTENVLQSLLLNKSFEISKGKKVKIVSAEITYENDRPGIWCTFEPVLDEPLQESKIGAGFSITALLTAIAALGVLFSIERIEKAVDSGTVNIIRIGAVVVVVLLVWWWIKKK